MIPPKKQTLKPSKKIGAALIAVALTFTGIAAVNIALPTPAYAQPLETRTKIVRYKDLNLASDSGILKLQKRIRRAAKYVCRPEGAAGFVRYRAIRHCIDKAESNARAQASRKIIQLQKGA